MAKKRKPVAANRDEAIENLVCAAVRASYPVIQLDWDIDKSLVETRFIMDLRLALKDLQRFNS